MDITCDSLETLVIPMSGKREQVKRILNGEMNEIDVRFYEQENLAYEIFSGGGSMYIEIRVLDQKKLTVSKSIKSSYFTEPYVVEMTYTIES
jgi:hypothetical protein